MTTANQFPLGWDEARIQKVIAHYENQTEDDALAEDETILAKPTKTVMEVPNELVSLFREIIAKHQFEKGVT